MYNLNINKSSVVPTNLIVGRVLDKPFDTFQFKIFDGLDPLDLTGATLDFRGVTPDNKKVISTNVKITDAKSGEIEFQLPTNFYSAQGQFRNAYFRINKSGLTESTNDLLINVLNAVDLNLDDSKIIIDQLDKIIEDAINKLDEELAGINAQLQKEKENIAQLQKDVASYRQLFDKQMADMQKQIDDLRGIINSTDVQRPQITKPDGNYYYLDNANLSILEHCKSLGLGTKKIFINDAKGIPERYMQGLVNISNNYNFITMQVTSVVSGNSYTFTHRDGKDLRWDRIDGQVSKLTSDDGKTLITLSDANKTTEELIKSADMGIKYITFGEAKDLPNPYIFGMMIHNATGSYRYFIGSDSTGAMYSYDTTNKQWNRLDGQVQKITQDDGSQKVIVGGSTVMTLGEFKKLGKGVHSVYINTLKDMPESNLKGILINQGDNEVIFQGQSMSGSRGIYSYNGTNDKWTRMDNGQTHKITSDVGLSIVTVDDANKSTLSAINSLPRGVRYVTFGFLKDSPEPWLYGLVSTNGPETNKTFIGSTTTGKLYYYNTSSNIWTRIDVTPVTNLLNQEAYYGVDGFLLDKLTNYEFVDVTATLAGNSVTTRYKVSPNVNFEIPLTNVYNDTSSTGFEVWEIQGSINDSRVTVSRSKGVKVGNTTTASNNTSDIRIVGIYGVNKIK